MGTAIRLLILVTLGWALWGVCVEGRTPDKVAVSSPLESDCARTAGVGDCCMTTQPFVGIKRVVVPGLELDSFAEGKSSFIPLTTATFVDFPDSEPRTFMINREKVNCLMPLTEALPIAAYPALARQK